MTDYRVKSVKNGVARFEDEKTGNVVYIPQNIWTPDQKAAMRQFLNPDKTKKFIFEGNC